MDRDTLIQWKSKIRDYQQQARNNQQPQQQTLFTEYLKDALVILVTVAV